MKIIAQIKTQPTVTTHPIAKESIENTSITIGAVIVIVSMVGMLVTVVKHIAEISTNANQLKNDFEKSDLLINNKIEILSTKLDNINQMLDQQRTNINKRVWMNEKRIGDIQMYLSKSGYIPRQYGSDDDTSSF